MSYRLVTERVEGRALVGNPLGDPSTRELPLLVPDGAESGAPLPLVFLLAGFSGVGRMMLADDPWSEGMVARLDRLQGIGRIGPMIIALPDCFTRLGGSQYINSTAVGRYEDHLWEDLLPAVKRRFPVGRVGVAGKSSGGYGAIVQAMRHPEIVSAVACHSGDMGFEYCYTPDIPKFLRAIWRQGGLAGFLAHFDTAPRKRDGRLMDAINLIAMAAAYSPDPIAPTQIDFPCDLRTAEFRPEVWARWLAWDPVRMVEQAAYADALRQQRLVFVDCGTRDEFFLDVGARLFASRLAAAGIRHTHEEFDDGHMNVTYRYDVSLPLLCQALRD